MNNITQIKVNGIIYDIVDARVPQWALQPEQVTKHNTTSYWNQHHDFVPAAGEIIVYDDGASTIEGGTIPQIKIGDGSAYISDLPFINAHIVSTLSEHISNQSIHTSLEEKEFWNDKVTCYLDTIDTETIVFMKN